MQDHEITTPTCLTPWLMYTHARTHAPSGGKTGANSFKHPE